MSFTQIGSLIQFVAGTTAVASQVNSNFDDIKTAFNSLVTGTNTIEVDIINSVSGANIAINDDVDITGALTVSGLLDLAGNLEVDGSVTFSGSVDFTNGVTLAGQAATDGASVGGLDHRTEFTTSGTGPINRFYAAAASSGGPTVIKALQSTLYYNPTSTGRQDCRALDVLFESPATAVFTEGGGAQTAEVFGAVITVKADSNAASGGLGYVYGMKINSLNQTPGARIGAALICIPSGGQTAAGESQTGHEVLAEDNYGAIIYAPSTAGGLSGDETVTLKLFDPPPDAGSHTYATILADSGALLTYDGVWTDASSGDRKSRVRPVTGPGANPAEVAALEAALLAIQPVRFDRVDPRNPSRMRADDIGFIAEDMPDYAMPGGRAVDRKGVAPGRVAAMAIGGWKLHEARLDDIEDRLTALENA